MEAQIDAQKMQLKAQVDVQVAAAMHQMRKEIEQIKAQAVLGARASDQEFREKIETMKESGKDERIARQAAEQSKLISQRKGEIPRLPEVEEKDEGLEKFLQDLI